MNLTSFLSVSVQAGSEPADLTWLAYIDIWIISGLVLLAVVVVLGKLIWGRLHRRDEEEEYDWYYDDDYILDDDNPDDRR
jgi:heme/copper-type cytochrome/quinol oxidase subunit 2